MEIRECTKRGINEEKRIISFIASDQSRDSYGTVLNPNGWDLSRYEKNPIVLFQHTNKGVNDIIGKGSVYVENNQLLIDVEFEPENLNPLADTVYKKCLFGSINAVSVGFIPKSGHWGEGEESRGGQTPTYYYDEQELMEVSIVGIPANANATKRDDNNLQKLEEENKRLLGRVKELELKNKIQSSHINRLLDIAFNID